MKNSKLYLSVIMLFVICALLQNCGGKEDVPCQNCVNNEVKSEVKDLYVRFLHSANRDTLLVSTNSITMETTRYLVCNSEVLRDIELTKILNVNGELLESCTSINDELIWIEDFEIINFCHTQGEEIDGVPPFFGIWLVNYISTPDTVLLPPCEGNRPIIIFTEESTSLDFPFYADFRGASINSYSGTFNIENNELIERSEEFIITTASPGTKANGFFDNLFFPFMQGDMKFNITNNLMTIESTVNENLIKLYYYENN